MAGKHVVWITTFKRLEFRWEGAWLVACERYDLRSPPAPLFVDEWTAGAVDRWLEREKPDVVIGPVLGTRALEQDAPARMPDRRAGVSVHTRADGSVI
jgi:hypothetical protein